MKSNLARIASTTSRALKEMRPLVYELRPPILENQGPIGASQQRLDMVEARAGVQARLLIETDVEIELPSSVEEAMRQGKMPKQKWHSGGKFP